MRIIVIQLARLGDIIQTLPAIQGLKKKYPGSEITLVARETFADAARLSPYLDRIVEFPTRRILGPVLSGGDKTEALESLSRWLAENVLSEGEYDLLINLTFSPASGYLATMIPARDRRGLHRLAGGQGDQYVITDAWSQYFFAQVLGNTLNVIHLNDLFTRIAGAGEGAWPLELNESAGSAVAPPEAGKLRVGIQLTASRPEKTLEASAWAAICSEILAAEPASELVFFGAQSDLPAIETVLNLLEEALGPDARAHCTIVAGTMRFHENTGWLRTCARIISPDTALVHLASACGTKVLEIAVGPVRPEETGPYGEGHDVIYFVHPAEEAQLATEVARVISGEKARVPVPQAITRLVRCVDGVPRNDLVPRNFMPEESSNFFAKAYYLLAEFRCAGRQEDVEIPKIGDPLQPGALDQILIAYDALCTIRRLSEFGQHYSVRMMNAAGDLAALGELSAKLAELEQLLDSLKKSVPLLKPLIDTWAVAKDVAYAPANFAKAASGKMDLNEVLELTEGSYRELGQNADILKDLLQIAVNAAQERAKAATPTKTQGKGVET
jgi:ADP-heptose:LPS heptosyltransferase